MALDILRLMRLIHSPHLVVVALGNLHSLRTIDELQARHKLTSFLHAVDAGDNEVKARAEGLGAFSMGKLFCPSQTISIYPPDTDDKDEWQEICGFRPDRVAKESPGLVRLFQTVLNKSFDSVFEKSGKNRPTAHCEIFDFGSNSAGSRRRIFKMPPRNLVSMYRVLSHNSDCGLKYPVEFCFELLEQNMVIEYHGGLPQDVFEFEPENINKVRVRAKYEAVANESDASTQGGPALLEYSEQTDGIEVKTTIRPTVAAWAHLLLCLHDGEVLGEQVISKRTKEARAKKARAKKARAKKAPAKKAATKGSKK